MNGEPATGDPAGAVATGTCIKRRSLPRVGSRLVRSVVRQLFRHRYLLLFTIFGFISICIEVALVALLPDSLGHWQTSLIGFLVGMVFAAFANAKFNFRVSNRRLWFTIAAFAGISGFSYSMNLMLLDWAHDQQWTTYPQSRFFTSGVLFLVAYWLHRRLTFRGAERDLGLAVYLAGPTDVPKMYERVGELADHIHLDLVDETFRADCAPVECGKIDDVLAYWPKLTRHVHIMSRKPSQYIDELLPKVDAMLFHVDVDPSEDLFAILARCREAGVAFGVVWHHTVSLADLLPWLPHADFVLVLGIHSPGASGQSLMPEAVQAAGTLARSAERYGYRMIFDGGVNSDTVHSIPASMIVSSSSVLRAENPFTAIIQLIGDRVSHHG